MPGMQQIELEEVHHEETEASLCDASGSVRDDRAGCTIYRGETRYFSLQLQDTMLLWERTELLLAVHATDFRGP